jgi:hypothetical protein
LDEELMAIISNYATLQSTIADYLNRSDLTSQIQTFIQFVEADLNSRLRAREMIVRATTTNDDEFVKLPLDFLEAINLQINGGMSPLRYITLDEADIVNARKALTVPTFYSLMNGAIELVPPPAQDIEIEMVYYGKIPALSDSNPTNWMLLKAPDVYLYGAMVHASPYLMDDPRVQVFGQIYLSRVESLNEEATKSLHSGSPLVARTRRTY